MGYQIRYGKTITKHKSESQRNISRLLLVGIIVVGGYICLHLSGANEKLVEMLLPGDPKVTAAALETMVAEMKDGVGIGQAFTAFCEEIIGNAVYPQ